MMIYMSYRKYRVEQNDFKICELSLLFNLGKIVRPIAVEKHDPAGR